MSSKNSDMWMYGSYTDTEVALRHLLADRFSCFARTNSCFPKYITINRHWFDTVLEPGIDYTFRYEGQEGISPIFGASVTLKDDMADLRFILGHPDFPDLVTADIPTSDIP